MSNVKQANTKNALQRTINNLTVIVNTASYMDDFSFSLQIQVFGISLPAYPEACSFLGIIQANFFYTI
ncbi:MAG: hypothetical protein NPMRTH1_780016 [Nitrosopumilales archaeon]|nr:MAG: hypothetical protein NPMRTH1_780016 [Nitrosopumilales archaeon]